MEDLIFFILFVGISLFSAWAQNKKKQQDHPKPAKKSSAPSTGESLTRWFEKMLDPTQVQKRTVASAHQAEAVVQPADPEPVEQTAPSENRPGALSDFKSTRTSDRFGSDSNDAFQYTPPAQANHDLVKKIKKRPLRDMLIAKEILDQPLSLRKHHGPPIH